MWQVLLSTDTAKHDIEAPFSVDKSWIKVSMSAAFRAALCGRLNPSLQLTTFWTFSWSQTGLWSLAGTVHNLIIHCKHNKINTHDLIKIPLRHDVLVACPTRVNIMLTDMSATAIQNQELLSSHSLMCVQEKKIRVK